MAQRKVVTRSVTGGLRSRAWWVIRKNKRFVLPDLLSTLADGNQKDPAANLRKYLGRLVRVGILEILPERVRDGKETSNGLYGYRLVRDVGPKAPVVRKNEPGVYDPNGKTVFEPLEVAAPPRAKPHPADEAYTGDAP